MPSKVFYLDIYNKIIEFNNQKITIYFDKYGNPWFIYRNILELLGYKDIKDAIKNIDIDNEFIMAYSNLKNIMLGGI